MQWTLCLGHTEYRPPHGNYLPTKDTLDTKHIISYNINTFSPPKSGLPLYSGQISWSQCVLCEEAPLYRVACFDHTIYTMCPSGIRCYNYTGRPLSQKGYFTGSPVKYIHCTAYTYVCGIRTGVCMITNICM